MGYVLIVALHYILAWKPRLMMNKSIGGIERYLLVVIKLLMEDLFAVLNDYAQLILGACPRISLSNEQPLFDSEKF